MLRYSYFQGAVFLVPTWYNSLSECALWICHFKLSSKDINVFQTVPDLDFKTAVLSWSEGMFDLVLDNKEVPLVSQKLFKVRFVMLIKLIGLFEDVFIQLGRATRTSSSMFCLPCTLGFFFHRTNWGFFY